MSATGVVNRIEKMADALQSGGGDAFFATHPISMQYLHGFPEDGHERFLTLAVNPEGEVVLICPALSATQAKRCGIEDIRSWRDGEDPLAIFRTLADEWNIRTGILYVDSYMRAQMLLEMQEVLPAALFKGGQPMLSALMRKKEPEELRLMKQAAEIADAALAPALEQLRPGMTEREFQTVIEREMQQRGGQTDFCIVAAGQNGAEPHHESDDTEITSGDVIVLDYGCRVQGYYSDITRMVALGRQDAEVHSVYKTVLDAHNAARAAICPGVPAEEIDRAARKVITECGYGENFVHRTGHGIGLRGHEEPYIVEGAAAPLEVGDCFSVEPGIYLPGKFGVRIENIVTVTDQGYESLNEEPSPTLIEIS